MLPTLSDRTRLLLEMDPPKPEVPIDRTAAQGHQRILEALREGDEDKAAKALRWQLLKGKKHLLDRFSRRQTVGRPGAS
jgi:DNA-binding GntR family transcriptional regulator